ncbi:MAG: hypothetical protein AB7I32_04905 [Gammaproteobacteria bacterium]
MPQLRGALPAFLTGLCAIASPALASAAPLLRHFDRATTEALGRAMYEQDRRASIAADLVRDNFDPQDERLVGYITSGTPPRLRVRFVRATEGGFEAAIDADFEDLLLPSLTRVADPALSPPEQAQIAARLTAAHDSATRCDGRYNTLALPDPDGDGWLVYALAATDEPDTIMIGGHVRYTISADGGSIEHAEPLATSCAKAPRAELERAAVTQGSEGLALRTSLAAMPLETHVFLSLTHELPLFVVGSDLKMWKVDAGHMQVVREKPGPATP